MTQTEWFPILLVLLASAGVLALPSHEVHKVSEVISGSKRPRPRMVIIGATGSGKSSMGNALLGLDPQIENALFEVCDITMDSCTKDTTAGTGQWLGHGLPFTVVDTPGLGDGDGQDSELITKMTNFLMNDLKEAEVIVLLLNGRETRFNIGLQNMLHKYAMIFGDRWWDNLFIAVSMWEFDDYSIKKRAKRCPGRNCKNEEWFVKEMQSQLKKKFHLDQKFEFAFIHSYSQTEENRQDKVQQDHWRTETAKLWNFASSRTKSIEFKDVNDVWKDDQQLKIEVDSISANFGALALWCSAQTGNIGPWILDPGAHWSRIEEESINLDLHLIRGQWLEVFIVGGGGAAGGSGMWDGGSSGFFQKYSGSVVVSHTLLPVNITIGKGGKHGNSGDATMLTVSGNTVSVAAGGGAGGLPGLSGGGLHAPLNRPGTNGGSNGHRGTRAGILMDNGSGESLPVLCGGTLTPGAAKNSAIHSSGNGYDCGGGGVIINGKGPARDHHYDAETKVWLQTNAEGYGAGGCRGNGHAADGVAIIMVCN